MGGITVSRDTLSVLRHRSTSLQAAKVESLPDSARAIRTRSSQPVWNMFIPVPFTLQVTGFQVKAEYSFGMQ